MSRDSKFTRGPWYSHDKYWDDICCESGAIVAQCVAVHSEEEGRANATLIASAPELYEALQHLLEHTEHKGNACKLLAVAKAEAALRKADGGTDDSKDAAGITEGEHDYSL